MANRYSISLFSAVVVCLNLFVPPVQASEKAGEGSTRVLAGIQSAQTLKSDLKFITELAQKGTAYENILRDNIDIFLIGVDETLPVRVDIVIDAILGQRNVWSIPLTDVKDFINNNLDPIDIKARLVSRNDRNFYELSGTVIDGWMRVTPEAPTYAVISLKKDDVPAEMPHPGAAHEGLIKEGFGSFLYVKNLAEGQDEREKSFNLLRDNTLGGLQKKPDESRESFELRKFSTQQSMDFLGRLFAETGETKVGTRIDREKKTANAEVLFAALGGTPLAQAIDKIVDKPSQFSGIPVDENAVLNVQVNFPFDSQTRGDYQKLYDLTRPVVAQEIDEDKKATETEKSARKKASDLFLNVLSMNMVRETLDLHISIHESGSFHNILLAIGCQGQEEISRLIDEVAGTKEGWSLEKNVAELEGVAIHKLSLGDTAPKSARDFYGSSGVVYLGVGPDAFWLAAGEGSMERLQTAVKAAKEHKADESSGQLVSVKARIRPLLENLYQFSKEGDISISKLLQGRGIVAGSSPDEETKEEGKESKKPAVGEGLRAHAQTLRNFEWQQPAIDALKGFDDTFELTLKRTDAGRIEGSVQTREGLMRAAGALVAKFAEENFK